MEKGEKGATKAATLDDRGMTVVACALGTGILIEQIEGETNAFSVHLSIPEAKLFVAELIRQIQNAQIQCQSLRTARSLYVQGLRIDEIADKLNQSEETIRLELKQNGYLREDNR